MEYVWAFGCQFPLTFYGQNWFISLSVLYLPWRLPIRVRPVYQLLLELLISVSSVVFLKFLQPWEVKESGFSWGHHADILSVLSCCLSLSVWGLWAAWGVCCQGDRADLKGGSASPPEPRAGAGCLSCDYEAFCHMKLQWEVLANKQVSDQWLCQPCYMTK